MTAPATAICAHCSARITRLVVESWSTWVHDGTGLVTCPEPRVAEPALGTVRTGGRW